MPQFHLGFKDTAAGGVKVAGIFPLELWGGSTARPGEVGEMGDHRGAAGALVCD